MILETLLAMQLAHSHPAIAPIAQTYNIVHLLETPVSAKSFSSSRSFSSSSSFRSSSSFSRPSSSSFSRPSSSSFSKPSSSSFKSSPAPMKAPSISAPVRINSQKSSSSSTISKPKVSSTSSTVRINKQKETVSAPVAPKTPVVSSPSTSSVQSTIRVPRTRTSAPVVTRETYIERTSDSGVFGNPWFWMYMMNDRGNRTNNYYGSQGQQMQPTQVLVKNSEGQEVQVPENQLIVRKYSYSPVREFFVFSLGGGIGVLATRKFLS